MTQNNLNTHSEKPNRSINPELLEKVLKLPRRDDVTLHFVDFDGTLANDRRRYAIYPELQNYPGDSAYDFIAEKDWDEADPSGFGNFVEKLQIGNHLLDGFSEFFDPNNPHHIILTAGNIQFQEKKIVAAGFWDAKKILVTIAEKKPEMMLAHLLELWYIPGKICFFDDRIHNFRWFDTLLSYELGIVVEFYAAIQDAEAQTVRVEKRVSELLTDI